MTISPDPAYQETIEYLYGLQKHGIKLAMENSWALMKIMGDPHRKFQSVHIAGTNGKGSTCAFIASILSSAGYRIGLYTSPHLVSFTERIRIDGRPISEARIVELAGRVRKGYEGKGGETGTLNPTFFEVTTAMAFTCFAEEEVDLAVVEVGMGGRLDSTNVITPLVSVITNIDLEHTQYLGTTLELIATEKAGIIKPGLPVITGANQPAVLHVIEQEANSRKAPLYRLAHDFRAEHVRPGREQRFDYRGMKASYDAIEIPLMGRHQIDNACLALAVIECLSPAGIEVNESTLRKGLKRARWEGRLERIAQGPDIYLDGAHNPASAQVLARAVSDLKRDYQKLILVFGVLEDKDVRGIISELVPLAERVIVTRPEYSRAMDLAALSAEVRRLHPAVEAAENVARAIEMAKQRANPGDLVLITGSLYVVGDARAAMLAGSEPSPSFRSLKG